MARSHAVWIVQDAGRAIVAAFTVKHELRAWLDTKDESDFTVTRTRDGRPHFSDPPRAA